MFFEARKVSIQKLGVLRFLINGRAKYALIERIEAGQINVYRAYAYPRAVKFGFRGLKFGSSEEELTKIKQRPRFFLQKGLSKHPQPISRITLTDWIKDSEEVHRKFVEGGYGNFKHKEGQQVINVIKTAIENQSPELFIAVVKDYNQKMAKEIDQVGSR